MAFVDCKVELISRELTRPRPDTGKALVPDSARVACLEHVLTLFDAVGN